MVRHFKTLLLWFLIAALPVQGLAAAIKSSCGPAHHTGVSVVTAHEYSHHAHTGHEHHHDDGDMEQLAVEISSLADKAQAKATGIYDSAFCSACAACCVGAFAPPPVVGSTPLYGTSEIVLISPPRLVSGFIPPGLERPPRNISA